MSTASRSGSFHSHCAKRHQWGPFAVASMGSGQLNAKRPTRWRAVLWIGCGGLLWALFASDSPCLARRGPISTRCCRWAKPEADAETGGTRRSTLVGQRQQRTTAVIDLGRCGSLTGQVGTVTAGAEIAAKSTIELRIQLVNATRSLNISAGVWKPSVLRGLWFNCLAIALS